MARGSGKQRTREQWEALVEEQASSNETIAQFCDSHGLTISNFYSWKAKLKNQDPTSKEPKNTPSKEDSWIALPTAAVIEQQSSWDIELNLPSGITLRVRSA